MSDQQQVVPGQQADSSAGHTHLPDRWQDWITSNVMRGCAADDLVGIMVENGFEPVFARHAVQIIASMGERLRRSPQAAELLQSSAYQAAPIRIPTATRFRLEDREVELACVMLDPNIAVIRGLLSDEECDQLIEWSKGKMKTSEVVDRESGASYQSNVRTSEGSHFERGENALIRQLEARIAALTGLPVNRGEPLQMLRYGVGGEYLAHQDFFDPADAGTKVLTGVGGQRIATLVMYLNDVEEGGDTHFPELDLSVKPIRGSAVYFEYQNDEGELDVRCLHAGMPVIRGEKWIMTKWLRERPYERG
ncbi:MAG: 2OG-Fe(II) oxygenase [Lautropia sp.]|nr:2OG-Fe(II) oxygenase [Lautropia sp.]